MGSIFVPLHEGLRIIHEDHLYEVVRPLPPNWVVARHVESGEERRLRIAELELRPETGLDNAIEDGEAAEGIEATSIDGPDLSQFTGEEWSVARERLAVIEPLLDDADLVRAKVEEAAKAAGCHAATVYRWIGLYRASGALHALIPAKRGRKKGDFQLPDRVNEEIELAIQEEFLSLNGPIPREFFLTVRRRMRNLGLKAPSEGTIRNRVRLVTARERVRRREGARAARDRYSPIRGRFPGADYPMAVVQVDHTEANVILVDDATRVELGRPWVTLAIDVYSRMVAGAYVSMERPNALATGICLSRAMLRKDGYLAALGVEGDWPVFGRIGTVHVDNAKEFRGRMLERACDEHNIKIVFRPVKRPNYGPHIERLMGTLSGKFRRLDGRTEASPKARGVYDADKMARMTVGEFEAWMMDLIVHEYHQDTVHKGLGMTPMRRWRESGTLAAPDGRLGGIVEMVADPDRLTFDFLPYAERTVQRYGVSLHDITYFDGAITKWILADDPQELSRRRKFTVRWDPRNISKIWFHDPDLDCYVELPAQFMDGRPISLLAYDAAKRANRQANIPTDPDSNLRTLDRLEGRVQAARAATDRRRKETKADRMRRHRARVAERVDRLGPATPVEPATEVRSILAASNGAPGVSIHDADAVATTYDDVPDFEDE